jgi:hypothetical protein
VFARTLRVGLRGYETHLMRVNWYFGGRGGFEMASLVFHNFGSKLHYMPPCCFVVVQITVCGNGLDIRCLEIIHNTQLYCIVLGWVLIKHT